MRTLFLLLLSCLPCFAQFGVEQPMFQLTSTQFAPTDIQGLAYWWNSVDLTNNVTATNWIDRIQGVVLTNGNLSARPTNSVYGVGFGGSTFLTNSVLGGGPIAAPLSYFMIVKWTDPNNTLSPITGYGTGASTLRVYLASKTWADTFASGCRWVEARGASTKITCLGAGTASVPTNSVITLSGCFDGGATGNYYTNGVLSFSAGSQTFTFDQVGHESDGNFFKGYINQILVYTNFLSATSVSNLNYYATSIAIDPGKTVEQSVLLSYDIGALGLNDGDPISSVTDGGPYGYTLTSSGGARPYWTNSVSMINNQGCAYYDGSSKTLTNKFTAEYPEPTHVFLVGNHGAVLADSIGWYLSGDAGSFQGLYEYNNEGFERAYAGDVQISGTAYTHDWKIWEVLYYGGFATIRTNNVIYTQGYVGYAGVKSIYMGGSFNPSSGKGWIANMIVCTNKINSVSASNLVQSLGTRYGITTYTRN